MTKIGLRRLVGAAAFAAGLGTGLGTALADSGDIREFSVGLKVSELPDTGYVKFTCVTESGEPGQSIAGWEEYGQCPKVEKGLHEVRFEYDDSDVRYEDLEGTAVAGHPVVISLLIDDDSIVDGIRVLTDPKAPLYHRRQAFLFRLAVLAKFGRSGWKCQELPLSQGESPVGTMHIKEKCERVDDGRRLYLETHLHRVPDNPPDNILRSTLLEIWRIPQS